MSETQKLEQRISELTGQTEALFHCLVTLANFVGPDARDVLIKVNNSIRGRVAIEGLQATEAFEVALTRIDNDLLHPIVPIEDFD